jgi:CheY-like chemotaxis protein
VTTLLAVDDSNTMRRVLEITFAGEDDLEVVLASGSSEALGLLGERRPSLVLVDVTLGAVDGYALCQQIKQASPRTPVVILASKQSPYDPSRGAACGADDHVDKPFDTQALIERVRGILERAPAVVEEAPQVPQPSYAEATAPPGPMIEETVEEAVVLEPEVLEPEPVVHLVQPPPMVAEPRFAQQPEQFPQQPVPQQTVPQQTVPQPIPQPARGVPSAPYAAAPSAPAASAPASHVGGSEAVAHANGNGLSAMKGRLGELGLTQDQVEAVLALSREIIEQAVWEVVPTLAETLIREEIARLTRE